MSLTVLGLILLAAVCHRVISVVLDDVIVHTKYGSLQGHRSVNYYGIEDGTVTHTVDLFLGVPYADPPIGNARFKSPRPPRSWEGIRNATEFAWVCPQMDIFHPNTGSDFQNEDCLYLDIYSPYEEQDQSRRYPVMVYIHGGSYEVGSGRLYSGQVLATFGVVVVTINYRLGALGFLSSGTDDVPGNFGILDQIEALKWVQDNIDRFRGDPNRVTIFGHSAGGASVGLLLTIPKAEGLFHAAIAQSGSATASYSCHGKMDFEWYMKKVAAIFHCPDTNMEVVVECLRRVRHQEFIRLRVEFPLFDPIDPEFRPVVDGDLIVDLPRTRLMHGQFIKVPFLIGTVKDEFDNYFNGGVRHKPAFDQALDRYVQKFTGYVPSLMDIIRFQYSDWKHEMNLEGGDMYFDRGALLSDMHMVAPTVDIADLVSDHNDQVFQYHFTMHHSFHSVELNYVFGAPFSGQCADELSVERSCGNFSHKDKEHSVRVMTLWTNFAKYRHPTPVGHNFEINWLKYSRHNRNYLHLATHNSDMRNHLRVNEVAFWNVLMPRLLNASHVGSIDLRQQHDTKTWAFIGISTILIVGIIFLLFLLVRTKLHQIHLEQLFLRNKPKPERV